MDTNQRSRAAKIDWSWLIVTYCFLVIFHLFPLYLIGLPVHVPQSMQGSMLFDPIILGLGVLFVSAYIGMKSKGITILEPGIASSLYVLTVLVRRVELSALPDRARDIGYLTLWLMLVLLLAFLLGCGGAAFGEWLQMRKQKKQMA